jgi:hypothetical protein
MPLPLPLPGEMIAVTSIINKRLTPFSPRKLDSSKPITAHSLHNHTTPTFQRGLIFASYDGALPFLQQHGWLLFMGVVESTKLPGVRILANVFLDGRSATTVLFFELDEQGH